MLPPAEPDSTPSQVTLTHGCGKMNRRRREAVIRFSKDTDSSNYYRSKLMLYLPWYNESIDLLGAYSSYEDHYNHVKRIILDNEAKYTQTDVDSMQVDEENYHGTKLPLTLSPEEQSPQLKVQSL